MAILRLKFKTTYDSGVDKNRITFNASGIRCINTGRIRVHTHDFPVDRLLVIKGVDRIQMRSFPLYQCLI